MEPNQPPSFIKINSNSQPYNIYLGNLQANFTFLLKKYILPNTKVVVIYDRNLTNLYLPLIINALNDLNIRYLALPFPPSEKNKSFKFTYKLTDKILKNSINRYTTVISLGGGITSDISGFIASITLRGLNFISIPTTILAAIDSSIGGKNGVNHSIGKNFLGSFYNPKAVLIDPLVFKTLPKREILSGLAEAIKYALISSKNFFNYLKNNIYLLNNFNLNFYNKILKESISIKKNLVELDFFDKKQQRALLNLGHTFGHALEVMNKYKNTLLHGEAVAIGLCLAAKFSSYIGLLPNNKANTIVETIKSYSLPTNYKPLYKNLSSIKKFLYYMQKDKKNINNNLNLILLEDIGKAIFVSNISTTKVMQFLHREYSKC